MTQTIYLAVGLLTPFITVLGFLLYYTNQVMDRLSTALENNRKKRDKIVLQILKSSKSTLDHVAASIREEVMEPGKSITDLETDRIKYYKTKIDEAYFSVDDAVDLRESKELALTSLSRIRFYIVVIVITLAIATFTLAISPSFYTDALGGFWILVVAVELWLYGYKIYRNYKIYKLVTDLLNKYKVGVHHENT